VDRSRSRFGHVAPTTPFPNNVMSGYLPHTPEGENRVYIFTENITQLIRDFPLNTIVLEFKFRRY
jgi:hypothetical protein